MRSFLLLTSLIPLLSGCGDSSSKLGSTEPLPTTVKTGTLYQASAGQLATWFNQNYANRDSGTGDGTSVTGAEAMEDSTATASMPTADASESNAADSSNGSSTTQASGTTLQEDGVDEYDRIKLNLDAKVMYTLYENSADAYSTVGGDAIYYNDNFSFEQGIRTLKLNNDGSVTETQKLLADSSWQTLRGMYFFETSQRVATIGSGLSSPWDYWWYEGYYSNQKTQLRLYNGASDGSLSENSVLDFDGALIATRSVGNTIYLVLRDSRYPEKLMTAESVAEYLPSYQRGSETLPLVDTDDCYLRSTSKTLPAYGSSVITLAAVDVSGDSPSVNSLCYIGDIETLYASTNALYLATTEYSYSSSGDTAYYSSPDITTDIHKFDFDGTNLSYRGSGAVVGHLGYDQNRKPFRLSESGDYLRVISHNEQDQWFWVIDDDMVVDAVEPASASSRLASPRSLDGSPALLTILKDTGSNTLETVSTLPNSQRTTMLGKTGEEVYATRYVGDRAYLVTFRTVDPLYVLNLSDPADPYIEGQIDDIAGYSDYLYPISETVMLGIGKDGESADSSISGDGRGAWYQGVKLSLFDFSDLDNPRETDTIVIGDRGSQSAALSDHHAFSQLAMNDGSTRIALPVQRHGEAGDSQTYPWDYANYDETGLYRYEIAAGANTFTALEPLIVADGNSDWQARDTSDDRSRIIDDGDYFRDRLYYLHNNQIWSQDWAGTETVLGPQ